MRTLLSYRNIRRTIATISGTALFLASVTQLPAVTPYTPDANTVMLDHLDGGTLGAFLGYQADYGPCGSQRPAAGPVVSFTGSQPNMGAALRLCGPNGQPPTGSYIRYNGYLLSQANGTLEFWVFLSTYATGLSLAEQGPFVGSCGGWTFGMGVTSEGALTASAWNAFNLNSGAHRVPVGQWTHLAVSWGSAGARLYINGQVVGTDASTGAPAPGYGGNVMMRFGTHVQGVCTMVDEIRISNVQRTVFNCPTPLPLTPPQLYAGLLLQVPAGVPCRIDYRSAIGDTNTWLLLTNFVIPANPYLFIDASGPASGSPQRFYRATANP